jgi:hypothetical protein
MNLYRLLFLPLVIIAIDLAATPAPGQQALEFHCAGITQLAGDSNLVTIQRILALRSTTNLQQVALRRFSRLLTNNIRTVNPASSNLFIEPLLKDVLEAESLGSFGGTSAEARSFILALRLDQTRMQLWQENLSKVLGSVGESFTSQGFSGSRWIQGDTNFLWSIAAHDWLLVGLGNDFSSLQAQYLKEIQAQGRPVPSLEHNWLEADLDTGRLVGWFGFLKPARIKITIAPDAGNLQINARLLEAEDTAWGPDRWRIPRKLMHRRTISFTAAQNVAALLKVNPAYSELPGNPLTNQFYCWASDQMPLLNYMAWPEADATNVLQRLSKVAPAALNPVLKPFNASELVWRPEANQLVWMNMSMFAPVLQAEQCEDGQFLLFSSFPLPENEPAPESILAHIEGRTNLVYYDWEFTGPRMAQWQMLSKMIDNRSSSQNIEIVSGVKAENEWLGTIARLAGETVTEVAQVSPREFSATRTGPIGFTAVELVLLADWICEANSGPIFPRPSGKPPGPKATPIPVRR